MSGWIGVDLDGTLAEYHGWVDVAHIGAPIPRMVDRVKAMLADGDEVRILTARVWCPEDGDPHQAEAARVAIEDWTEKHLGKRLKVTNEKDFEMVELWDDRAVSVQFNTGYAVSANAALWV